MLALGQLTPAADGEPCLAIANTDAHAVVRGVSCSGAAASGPTPTGIVLDHAANVRLDTLSVESLFGVPSGAGRNATGAVGIVLRDVTSVDIVSSTVSQLQGGGCVPTSTSLGPGGPAVGVLLVSSSSDVSISGSRLFELAGGDGCDGTGGYGGDAIAVGFARGATLASLTLTNVSVAEIRGGAGGVGSTTVGDPQEGSGGDGGSACGLCLNRRLDGPQWPGETGDVSLGAISVAASTFSDLQGGAGGRGAAQIPESGEGGRGGDAIVIDLDAPDDVSKFTLTSFVATSNLINIVTAGDGGAGGAMETGGEAGGSGSDAGDSIGIKAACDIYSGENPTKGSVALTTNVITQIHAGAGGAGGVARRGSGGEGGDGGDAEAFKIESCAQVKASGNQIDGIYGGSGGVGGDSGTRPDDGGSGGDARAMQVSTSSAVSLGADNRVRTCTGGSGASGGNVLPGGAGHEGGSGGDAGDAIGLFLTEDCSSSSGATCDIGFTAAADLTAGAAGNGGTPDGDDGDSGRAMPVRVINYGGK